MGLSQLLQAGLGIYAGLGLVTLHALAARRRDATLFAICLLLDAIAATLIIVAALAPATFYAWMQEDGWAEWGTFFAFVAAGALMARAAWRAEGDLRWLRRLGLAAVALFCVFVAGEEISWGQRLFAFAPPEVFLEHNFQQELNVHNFLKDKQLGALDLDSRYLVALIAIVYGLLAPALMRWRRLADWRPTAALGTAAPSLALSPYFALVALAELSYPVDLTGEACELVLGVLFLANAALRTEVPVPSAAPPRRWRRLVVAASVVLGLSVATPVVLQHTLYGTDEERAGQAVAELTQLQRDLQRPGAIRRRLLRKRRVHKRVFTAIKAGYLTLGSDSAFLERQPTPAEVDDKAQHARRDRRGYFLDPWNNPYWLHKSRRGLVTLYSFGANRRRDGRLRRLVPGAVVPGDDIAVRFRIPRETMATVKGSARPATDEGGAFPRGHSRLPENVQKYPGVGTTDPVP